MSLLKPAVNQTAYMKAGILGFQGAGKTYTASRIAAGLVKFVKIKNPKVAMFDTEKSSDFLVPFFKEQKIEFMAAKSRAFHDLLDVIHESEKAGVHVMIVDSVTHVWRELMNAYKKRNGDRDLSMRDWGPIKDEWASFTELFVNSKMHVLALGRAGYEYDEEENERTHKKNLVKVGTKMKAEGEFGYESDILLEMERIQNLKTGKTLHRCWVIKDRWDELDGEHFDDPTFESFLPFVKHLALGEEHFGVDVSRDSTALFEGPDFGRYERLKQRDISIEELQAILIKAGLDGTSSDAKKKRTLLLEEVFGSASKTAIESKSAIEIRQGIEQIKLKTQLSHIGTWEEKKVVEDVPL